VIRITAPNLAIDYVNEQCSTACEEARIAAMDDRKPKINRKEAFYFVVLTVLSATVSGGAWMLGGPGVFVGV
jgi:hypothetical protein